MNTLKIKKNLLKNGLFLLAVLFACASCSNQYLIPNELVVKVTEPYIDLRENPDIDSPIFYSVEQDELLQIFDVSKGFFKVKTNFGHQGWIDPESLIKTHGLQQQKVVINRYGVVELVN